MPYTDKAVSILPSEHNFGDLSAMRRLVRDTVKDVAARSGVIVDEDNVADMVTAVNEALENIRPSDEEEAPEERRQPTGVTVDVLPAFPVQTPRHGNPEAALEADAAVRIAIGDTHPAWDADDRPEYSFDEPETQAVIEATSEQAPNTTEAVAVAKGNEAATAQGEVDEFSEDFTDLAGLLPDDQIDKQLLHEGQHDRGLRVMQGLAVIVLRRPDPRTGGKRLELWFPARMESGNLENLGALALSADGQNAPENA